jgi:heat shock protein HslJ
MKVNHIRVILLIVLILLLALAYRVFIYKDTENTDNRPVPENVQLDQTTKKILGHSWKWNQTVMVGKTIIDSSDSFSITMTGDGKVQVTTDCNDRQGMFTLGDNQSVIFDGIATTKMYCEGSQEQDFLSDLLKVESYQFEDDKLILLLQSDSGKMEFSR